MFDLKITGGAVIDGTGKPSRSADVAISAGRIAAIGPGLDGEARETIDATDRVVCPGFVDVHTHYDAQVMWDRRLSISPWHGVTTCVMGNCGLGLAPTRPVHRQLLLATLERTEGMSLEAMNTGLGADWPFTSFPEYLDAIERQGVAINVSALIGHTPIRLFTMGEDAVKQPATSDQIDAMARLVRDALEAGAVGFSTTRSATQNAFDGYPVPSRLATTEEMDRMVAAACASGRGLLQATFGPRFFSDEFGRLAETYGCTVTWNALLADLLGPGSHRRLLDRAHQQQRRGLNVVPQVSCRAVSSEVSFADPHAFEHLPLFAPTMTVDAQGKRAFYRDPAFRAAFRADTSAGQKDMTAGWTGRTVIAYVPGAPELAERPLAEVAEERGVDPVDLALDLALATGLEARFRLAVANWNEADVAELLLADGVVLATSDAGAHANQLCDACYSTHLLGHWVREKQTLTLERAVEMLTRTPADLFGLFDRGRLAPGLPADVVVFDPKTVAAGPLQRVYDLPAGADRLVSEAIGIEAVICNGALIRQHGEDIGDGRQGRVLRAGRA
jgi:N-acyl-D-aspartate/D-glutamate deacylase